MDPMNQQPMTRHERRALQRQQKQEHHAGVDRAKTMKRFGTWFIVLALLAGSVWGIIALSKSTPGSTGLDPVTDQDWTRGPRESKVVLIEYSDLQCPACAAYLPVLKTLLEKDKDKFLFVYRHFPLKSTHQFAELAARHAEAAGMQGKFWEFHDLLFEKQLEWSREKEPAKKFVEYASSLGLNTDQLAKDAAGQSAKDKVETQYQGGLRVKVDSTPTFFLNGSKLNLSAIGDLQTQVEAAIAATP